MLQVIDGGFGEDESDFFLDKWFKNFEFRDYSTILLFEMRELIFFDSFSSHIKHFLDESLSDERCTFLEMTRILLSDLRNFLICWI